GFYVALGRRVQGDEAALGVADDAEPCRVDPDRLGYRAERVRRVPCVRLERRSVGVARGRWDTQLGDAKDSVALATEEVGELLVARVRDERGRVAGDVGRPATREQQQRGSANGRPAH